MITTDPELHNRCREALVAEAFELAKNYQQSCSSWRWGQCIFNAFYKYFPEDTNKLQGTEIDCFYLDSRVEAFLDHFNFVKEAKPLQTTYRRVFNVIYNFAEEIADFVLVDLNGELNEDENILIFKPKGATQYIIERYEGCTRSVVWILPNNISSLVQAIGLAEKAFDCKLSD